jgi:hypothetical protein
VQPLAAQPRQQILVLRQFDLDAALVRARVGGEDIQDQPGAVEHLHLQRFFEVARLCRRQLIVEHHQVIFQLVAQRGDLFGLAGADKVLGEGLLQPLVHAADHLQVGGIGQQRQLLQRILRAPQAAVAGQLCAYQERAVAWWSSIMHTLATSAGRDHGLFFDGRTPLSCKTQTPRPMAGARISFTCSASCGSSLAATTVCVPYCSTLLGGWQAELVGAHCS